MTISYDDLAHRLAAHRGDWLRKSLDASGVTAREMAVIIDVSTRTMTNYLAGATTPRERMLKQWAMRTGVPLTYLKTGTLPTGDDGNGLDSTPVDTDRAALAQLVEQFTRNDESNGSNILPMRRAA